MYAAFLPPGYHKFLIYDPISEKAYAKTMLINLNKMDFYPDLPKPINAGIRKKVVLNVWREWEFDTPESLSIMFSNDAMTENYEP